MRRTEESPNPIVDIFVCFRGAPAPIQILESLAEGCHWYFDPKKPEFYEDDGIISRTVDFDATTKKAFSKSSRQAEKFLRDEGHQVKSVQQNYAIDMVVIDIA